MYRLNYIIPYYDSPAMLKEQVRRWRQWPDRLLEKTTFIVVDDASPKKPLDPAMLKTAGVNAKAFRIRENVAWNWRAARNIGAHEADDGLGPGDRADLSTLLLTDIDHVLPADQAQALFDAPLAQSSTIYQFSRREAFTRKPYRMHTSSWLMTRAQYWAAGGIDESFAGCYIGILGEFKDRLLRRTGCSIERLNVFLLRYSAKNIDDSTAKLPRRSREDEDRAARIRETWTGPKALTFAYDRVL